MTAHEPIPVQGERRLITVLFADVVGSTTLAERMDPEDWTVIMNRAFAVLSQAIVRYEGTIGQFIGDEILAYFGAPSSHEDDAQRAVRAALDMIAGIDDLAVELHREQGIDFKIRVGINTGLAIVGEVGSEAKREYTAMGDTVNVAARMRSAARPGTVLIAEPTFRLIAPQFECTPMGLLEVKGKTNPVAAYEVRGVKTQPDRLRGIPGLHSPMVGRLDEIERLRQLLDLLRAGLGRAAAIIGEPGIGKSRLVTEWRAGATAVDVRWVQGSCLSYGRGLAYHLLLDLVRSLVDAPAGGDEAETRTRLRTMIRELLGDEADDVYTDLGHLMSLRLGPGAGDRIERLDAHARQSHYLNALRRLLIAAAQRQPLVLVCDDVHWADPSSVDLLVRLLPMIHDAPILVALTLRPDRETDGWRLVTAARELFGEAFTEIVLTPLSAVHSQGLIANLLEIETLPAWLRQMILSKAEGNPFFLEEVVRMLIDRGAIAQRGNRWVAAAEIDTMELPDTLRGLLRARIDRLPAEAADALKVAAVIGREFSVRVLREIVERPQLGVLEGWALIRPATAHPEVRYAFTHALLADAAYDALLKRDRARLHLQVGQAIERLYPERDEVAGVLAYHFENAADRSRATQYLIAAGRHALGRYAVREARAFLDRAASLLAPDHADAEGLRRAVGVNLMRVAAGYTFVPFDDDLALAEATLPLAQTVNDPALLAESYYLIASLRHSRGDSYETTPALREAIERTLEIGSALGDAKYRGLALVILGDAALQSGNYRLAIERLEEALPILEAREEYARASIAGGLMAVASAVTGHFDRAHAGGQRALEWGRMSGDPNALMDAQLFMGRVEAERGNLMQAMDLYRQGVALAEEAGNTFCATVGNLWLGAHHIRMGQPELGAPALEKSAQLAQFCNMAPLRGVGRAWLGAVYYERGEVTKATQAWDAGLAAAEKMGDRLTAAEIRRQRAAAIAKGDSGWESAKADFQAAIAAFDQIGARPYLARTLRDFGRALSQRGETAAAREKLGQAEALFAELKMAL